MKSKKEMSAMKYPNIKDIQYLSGHDLLIRFDNGEDRICDMSMFFAPDFSKKYYSFPEFMNFKFAPSYIYWGDEDTPEDYSIGTDSLYPTSFPHTQVKTSSISIPDNVQSASNEVRQDLRARTVSKGVNFKTGEGIKGGPWHSIQEARDYYTQLAAEDYDDEL